MRCFVVAGCALAAARGVAAQGGATLVGTVRDSLGAPIANAEIRLGSALRAFSDDHGDYRLAGFAAGTFVVQARRLGFRQFNQSVVLEASAERRLNIVLASTPQFLSTMDITATKEEFQSRLAGFNERSKQHVGHFVTRERIDQANSVVLSDMLRELPGVKIGGSRNEGRAIRFRGADCAPLVFVDGFPATAGEFDVDIIDLKSVEGIEVYSGLASIPPEFSGPRDLNRCGVIAIWSRPFRPRTRQPTPDVEATVALLKSDPTILSEVLTADEVDVPARLAAGGAPPQYPDSLLRGRISGRVVVEIVVDASGGVEPGTLDILMSTNPLFTDSVRDALAKARFVPAQLGSHQVRQFVQLPFNFSPPPATSSAPGDKRP